MKNRNISREAANQISQSNDLSQLINEEIISYFHAEDEIRKFSPDGYYEIDPRNGDRIVFSSARARRPHDNKPAEEATQLEEKECLICNAKTTGIIDLADLSDGFTFINKNLFPVVFPAGNGIKISRENEIQGMHFLQWTSSNHEKDWHNMPLADRLVVMQRLALLEQKLLEKENTNVLIIKNYGHLVGGSLVHGHQQIASTNVTPQKFVQDASFFETRGETFSTYMMKNNPPELVIKDYGKAVLLTPYFMRRPYDMYLLLKDTSKRYIHDLDQEESKDICEGWKDGINIMRSIMPMIGKETAYNITTHNGKGAGLYFEFLPYTQEMGGFEHLGLFLCQGNPKSCAGKAREILEKNEFSE